MITGIADTIAIAIILGRVGYQRTVISGVVFPVTITVVITDIADAITILIFLHGIGVSGTVVHVIGYTIIILVSTVTNRRVATTTAAISISFTTSQSKTQQSSQHDYKKRFAIHIHDYSPTAR